MTHNPQGLSKERIEQIKATFAPEPGPVGGYNISFAEIHAVCDLALSALSAQQKEPVLHILPSDLARIAEPDNLEEVAVRAHPFERGERGEEKSIPLYAASPPVAVRVTEQAVFKALAAFEYVIRGNADHKFQAMKAALDALDTSAPTAGDPS